MPLKRVCLEKVNMTTAAVIKLSTLAVAVGSNDSMGVSPASWSGMILLFVEIYFRQVIPGRYGGTRGLSGSCWFLPLVLLME